MPPECPQTPHPEPDDGVVPDDLAAAAKSWLEALLLHGERAHGVVGERRPHHRPESPTEVTH